MRLEPWVGIGLKATAVIGIGAVAILLLKRLGEQTEDENQRELDLWMNSVLAKALAEKLGQPTQTVLNALYNPDRSPLADRIQQTIQSVNVFFTRRSSHSRVVVKSNIDYRDGTKFSMTIEKDWENLPATIRREFLQTGNPTVHRPWKL